MSELLGQLQLSGKGGNELYVYDDCLVRASTGLVASLTGGSPVTGIFSTASFTTTNVEPQMAVTPTSAAVGARSGRRVTVGW